MVGTLAALVLAFPPALSSQDRPNGFLATPPSGNGPGVLVLHPWWGLNADVKGFCKRLAGEGFVAFAPDLFDGKVATTIAQAEALVKAAKDEVVWRDVLASTKFLKSRVNKPVAVVGFSFGAYYALKLSNSESEAVTSVVVFYGTGESDFSKSKARYLGHFAGKDPFEPKASVDGLKVALGKWHRPAVIHTYPGTGHWFFEPSRKDAYNKAAADLAWKRTLAFLKKP